MRIGKLGREETNKKKLEEIEKKLSKLFETRLKQFGESIEAKYERLYDEVMPQNKDRLKVIKNKKARQEEMNVLGILGSEETNNDE